MSGAVVEEIQNHHEDDPIVEDVKVEDDHVDDSDDIEDDKEGGPQGAGDGSIMSRSERTSRKAMMKLGMKAVVGVSKVTIKKTKDHVTFCILKPDVFKSPNSETYLISGEAKMDDYISQLETQAAQRFRMPDMSSVMEKTDAGDVAASKVEEKEEEVNETGLEPKDIELVMNQAGVSRAKAVKALKASDGDLVHAIMDVTN